MIITNNRGAAPPNVIIQPSGRLIFSAEAKRLLPSERITFGIVEEYPQYIYIHPAHEQERGFKVGKNSVHAKQLVDTVKRKGRFPVVRLGPSTLVIDLVGE